MAEGGNEKLLLDAVPLDDSGEYEIPDARPLEQLETYVPSCTRLLLLQSDIIGACGRWRHRRVRPPLRNDLI